MSMNYCTNHNKRKTEDLRKWIIFVVRIMHTQLQTIILLITKENRTYCCIRN